MKKILVLCGFFLFVISLYSQGVVRTRPGTQGVNDFWMDNPITMTVKLADSMQIVSQTTGALPALGTIWNSCCALDSSTGEYVYKDAHGMFTSALSGDSAKLHPSIPYRYFCYNISNTGSDTLFVRLDGYACTVDGDSLVGSALGQGYDCRQIFCDLSNKHFNRFSSMGHNKLAPGHSMAGYIILTPAESYFKLRLRARWPAGKAAPTAGTNNTVKLRLIKF